MAFNPAYQPFPNSIGNLALGACKVKLDGIDAGCFHDAGFAVTPSNKIIKSGYPAKAVQSVVSGITATAYVQFHELGSSTIRSLLSSILSSLVTDDGPATKDLSMEVFRPRGKNVVVDFSGAALLQQFEISLGYDFNSVRVDFEALFPGTALVTSGVQFSETADVSYSAPSWLGNSGNVSVGFSRISVGGELAGSLQSATIKLMTNYKRIEAGYPKLLRKLVPLDYSLEVEFTSEEFTTAALSAQLGPGTTANLSLTIPTYDGNFLLFNLPKACLISGSPQLKQDDWSGITWKYTALEQSGVVATIS